jgi:hypothetical protein
VSKKWVSLLALVLLAPLPVTCFVQEGWQDHTTSIVWENEQRIDLTPTGLLMEGDYTHLCPEKAKEKRALANPDDPSFAYAPVWRESLGRD